MAKRSKRSVTIGPPFGFAIFCDDIREEVGGKVTYAGVYSDTMQFPRELPAVVPIFSVVATLFMDSAAEVSSLRIELAMPGQAGGQTVGVDLDPQELKPGPEREEQLRRHIIKWKISPLVITESGQLIATALVDDVRVELGRLDVLATDARM